MQSVNCSRQPIVNELQHVLGLLQYYRIFIPKFAHIARPMTKLLSKSASYVWSEDCQKSFEFLRNALCSYPVLTCYDNGAYITCQIQGDVSCGFTGI